MALGGGAADVHPCYRGSEHEKPGGVRILYDGMSRLHGCYAAVPEGSDSYPLRISHRCWHPIAGVCTFYLPLVPRALAAIGVVLARRYRGWRQSPLV